MDRILVMWHSLNFLRYDGGIISTCRSKLSDSEVKCHYGWNLFSNYSAELYKTTLYGYMDVHCRIPSAFLSKISHNDKLKKKKKIQTPTALIWMLDLYLLTCMALVKWLHFVPLWLILYKVEVIMVPSSDHSGTCQWSGAHVVLRTVPDTVSP